MARSSGPDAWVEDVLARWSFVMSSERVYAGRYKGELETMKFAPSVARCSRQNMAGHDIDVILCATTH